MTFSRLSTRCPSSSSKRHFGCWRWHSVPPLCRALASNATNPQLFLGTSLKLPPLPPIRDPKRRQQVFTHSSWLRRAVAFEDPADDPAVDNERLEFLGDSVLRLAVTTLLEKLYPNVRPGGATEMRDQLVCNMNFSTLSRRYELIANLRSNLITSDLTMKPHGTKSNSIITVDAML